MVLEKQIRQTMSECHTQFWKAHYSVIEKKSAKSSLTISGLVLQNRELPMQFY